MPKERLHLLLADLTLRRMKTLTHGPVLGDRWKQAFLHGAMAPDLLFYDLPFFRLPAVGNRLHRLMERPAHAETVPDALVGFLPTPEASPYRPWLLGMAHHFMVDSRWHPLINGYIATADTPCHGLRLNNRDCHHWLESELEAFWLERLGPPCGYADFLRWLRSCSSFRRYAGNAYASLLLGVGILPVPAADEITRCSAQQAWVMLEFLRPFWRRLKNTLLAMKFTRYVGSLITPLPRTATGETLGSQAPEPFQRLWKLQFVEETVDAVARAFLSLPGWPW